MRWKWRLTETSEDLQCADYICLMIYIYDIKTKFKEIHSNAKKVNLKICLSMRLNTNNTQELSLNTTIIEVLDVFTSLGIITCENGGIHKDVQTRAKRQNRFMVCSQWNYTFLTQVEDQ